jgi:amino acid transporter
MKESPVNIRGKLKKELTFWDLVTNGLIFIGPASAIGIFGVLDAKSNGAVASVYLLATAVMSLTAMSYVQMALAVPKSGSIYAYAKTAFGAKIGFLSGWMMLLDYILIPAVAYLFSGIAFNALIPQVPAWIFTLCAVIVTLGLNIRGIKNVAIFNRIILLAGLVVLSLILIFGVYLIFTHDTPRTILSPFTGIGTFSPHALISAVSVAVLSFLGFDGIATFAEEHKGAKNTLGRAILLCLVIAGFLFILQSFVGGVLALNSPEYFRAHPELQGKAYYSIINQGMSPILSSALALVKAFGASCAAMVAVTASSRLVYGIASDGVFSEKLSQTNQNFGTPVLAVLSSSSLTLIIAVSAARVADGLDILVSLVNIGALSAFFMLHLAVIKVYFIQHKSSRIIRHLFVPVLGCLSIATIIILSSGFSQLIALAWLAFGITWSFYQRVLRN